MAVETFGLTDVGRQRTNNEDSILVLPAYALGVVCDGMGGHYAGEVASRAAVDTIQDWFASGEQDGGYALDLEVPAPGRRMAAAMIEADATIRRMSASQPGWAGMGTTGLAAMVVGDALYVAHAGDSRAYLARGEVLHQLTIDHTVVRDLIRAGIISEAQAGNIQRNAITRALGVGEQLVVDVDMVRVRPGDTVLLCSDGLYGLVDHLGLTQVMCAELTLEDTCRLLIGAANAAGGTDNVSAVLLRVEP